MDSPHNLLVYRSNGRFRISAYNVDWPIHFATIKKELESDLIADGVTYISIEHVGSTSVPNLRAKAIIDILLIIDPSEFHEAKRLQILEALSGKTSGQGAYHNNHGDGGVQGRWTLKVNGVYPYRSLYVVASGSIPHRNPIDLRDTLRQCPDLRNEYERIKRDLAKTTKAEDLGQYSVNKGPMIRKILKRAGWTDAELDEMQAQNQRKGKELEWMSMAGVEEDEIVEAAREGGGFCNSAPVDEESVATGVIHEESCREVASTQDGMVRW
ncbi:hypothetical protein P7C71_g5362, partial [Lecanoromycetidae sp. Uapishka_2]